jgi:hypothetical protein
MVRLSPKQDQAWELLEDPTHTEILYGGGAGGGKSWMGALWVLANCLRYPGSRYLMGRAVLKTLKETTLNSFFDVCQANGLKKGVHYNYNPQTSQIQVGDSTIILKDLATYPSDPNFDDLGSLEITGAFIDEANQISAKAKSIVGSRIRYKLDEFGLVPKMLMTCNPAKNWVFAEFYKPWKDGKMEAHRAFVPALVSDNPSISEHYVTNLSRLKGADRARLLLGDWDYDDNPDALIRFDAISDLFTNKHVPSGKPAMVVDVAGPGKDKTVISVWDGLRAVKYYVEDISKGPDLIAKVERIAKEQSIYRSRIVIDADGIGGMGLADHLPGCVRFIANAKAFSVANNKQSFRSFKAQCGYLLAEKADERGMHIADDTYREEIVDELAWLRSWKVDKDGPKEIMPKDKIKEGLGRSPDYLDNSIMRMALELKAPTSTFEDAIAGHAKAEQERRFKEFTHAHFPVMGVDRDTDGY